MLIVSFLLLIFIITEECRKRDFGFGGHVCVCSEDYCDTTPELDKPEGPGILSIYTSNRDGLRFHESKQIFIQTETGVRNRIVVNPQERYQTIIGWGGAFTDSTGINIKSLTRKAQRKLLESYFSKSGIEYSLCRVPIGGTDFSTRAYSYLDDEEDPDLKGFKLAKEDFEYKIPMIKKALKLTRGKMRLFASAWTAPKWMKTNGEYYGYGFLRKSMYQPWARYHLLFLEKYAEQGINFFGMTTGNEPGTAFVPKIKINVVGWLPPTQAAWIGNNLGPTLRSSRFSDIKIMILDDQRYYVPWVLNFIFSNETVKNYIDGIALHWYFDTIIPPVLVQITHEHYPEKFLLATEACVGVNLTLKHVELGSWQSGEQYASSIIEDMLNWFTGWVDWNMVLNMKGGPTYINNYVNSPIIVNSKRGEFYKQPMFYALGHFSKFVPPDSVRIGSSQFDNAVPAVAFRRPDNRTSVIILNTKNQDVSVTLTDKYKGSTVLNLTKKSITSILY